MTHIDIVFAKTADPNPDFRFVEVEDASGASVEVGEWIDRGNGLWALRVERQSDEPFSEADAMRQMSGAWLKVFETLCEVVPDFRNRTGPASDRACNAIRDLVKGRLESSSFRRTCEEDAFDAWLKPRNFTSASADAARLGWEARAALYAFGWRP